MIDMKRLEIVLLCSSLLMLAAAIVYVADGSADGRATVMAIGSALHSLAAGTVRWGITDEKDYC